MKLITTNLTKFVLIGVYEGDIYFEEFDSREEASSSMSEIYWDTVEYIYADDEESLQDAIDHGEIVKDNDSLYIPETYYGLINLEIKEINFGLEKKG